MTSTNNTEWELIGKGLIELQAKLLPFINNKMTQRYGETWLKSNDMSRVIQRRNYQIKYNLNNLDLNILLDIIDDNTIWQRTFQEEFERRHRSEIIRLKEIRNRHAHPSVSNQFTLDEVDQALYSMLVLIEIIETNENQEIKALRKEVLRRRYKEQTDPPGTEPPPKPKSFVLALLAIPILSIAAIWVGNKYVLADKEKPLESPSQQSTITDSNNPKQTLQAKPNTPKHTLQAKSLKIGILSDPKYYSELADYLRSQFGDQVEIVVDGRRSMPYSEARKRLVKQEWDIAFTVA